MDQDSISSDDFDPQTDYSAAIRQLQGGFNPVIVSLTSEDDYFSEDLASERQQKQSLEFHYEGLYKASKESFGIRHYAHAQPTEDPPYGVPNPISYQSLKHSARAKE